jgi:hypothetical protein
MGLAGRPIGPWAGRPRGPEGLLELNFLPKSSRCFWSIFGYACGPLDDVYFGIFFEINSGVVTFPDSSLICLVPQVSSCHLRKLSPSCLWRVNLAFVLLLVALDFELDRENTKIAQNTCISRYPPKTQAYTKMSRL